MKYEPTNKVTTPGYPTLAQVKKYTVGKTIAKVAAVTALTAAVATGACACGDEKSNFHGDNIVERAFGGYRDTKETMEVILDGDVAMTSETILEGEQNGYYQIEGEMPPETDYDLMGDEPVETYIEGVIDAYDA